MTATKTRRFVRADGPDKVTGSGRYTADLTLTGMLAAKFRYADVSHARITKLDVSAARGDARRVRRAHRRTTCPTCASARSCRTARCSPATSCASRARSSPPWPRSTRPPPQRAVDAIVVEYEPLPVVNDIEAALAADAPLVHDGLGRLRRGRRAGARPQRRVVLLDRQGRRRRRLGRGRPWSCAAATWPTAATRHRSNRAPWSPSGRATRSPSGPARRCRSTPAPACARRSNCRPTGCASSCPHLGGGFGGKCGFHYEAHVAALARAAKRPVRLVFSRREEFIAPDRRREGIVFDIETGVNADGTITARTVWLAHRQRRLHRRRRLLQPARGDARRSGRTGSPTCSPRPTSCTPTTSRRARCARPRRRRRCWALESHTDEVAAAIGHGPGRVPQAQRRRHRRRGPQRPDLRRDRRAAVHRPRPPPRPATARPLPDDEAIGVAIGWWPSFSVPSGAYIKIDGDGSGPDHHRRAGVRHRRGDDAAPARRRRTGHAAPRTSSSSTRTPASPRTTWAPPARRRCSTTVAPSSPPPARSPSSCASWPPTSWKPQPADIVLADGMASVAGTPDASRADRRAGRHRRRRRAAHRPRLGRAARRAPARRLHVRRRPRHGRVGRPAVLVPRGAGEARSRHRRRPRAARQRRPRLGHDHQPDRRARARWRAAC